MAKQSFRGVFVFLQNRSLRLLTPESIPSQSLSSLSSNGKLFKAELSKASPDLTSSISSPLENLRHKLGLRLDEKKTQNVESLISCLQSFGFMDTHITYLLPLRPSLLNVSVTNITKPKLEWLVENGVKDELLVKVITVDSSILCRSLDKHLKPSWETLKTLLKTEDKVLLAIKRYPRLLTWNVIKTMALNFGYLLKQGVPLGRISGMTSKHPRLFLHVQERFISASESIRNIGIGPTTPMFMYVLRVRLSVSELNWVEKLNLFKSFGWSEDDISATLRSDPFCFTASAKKIKQNMDFLIDVVNLEHGSIVKYARVLQYSFDTIKARYQVLEMLESKNLMKQRPAYFFSMSKKNFSRNYIEKYMDILPELKGYKVSKKEKRKVLQS